MKTWSIIALAGLAGTLLAEPVKLDAVKEFGKRPTASVIGDVLTITGPDLLIFYERIPFNPKAKYTLSCEIRLPEGEKSGAWFFAGYYIFDKAGKQLTHHQVMAYPGTGTKLAADVKAGDKIIKIADGSKWKKSASAFAAFNAKEDCSDLPNRECAAIVKKVEQVNGVWEVTLGSPVRKNYPAGTGVREHADGGYLYTITATPKSEWTKVSGTLSGMPAIGDCTVNPPKTFWPCTAKIRPIFMTNWRVAGKKIQIRNVTLDVVK